MDSKRFDNWIRNRAESSSRRRILRAAGAGGLSVVATHMLPGSAHAQGGPATCAVSLHAELAAGPSAPVDFDGALEIEFDGEGRITEGTFTPTTGTRLQVSGSVNGRAIDIQIALSPDEFLVLSGLGEQPIATCAGAIAGLFSGPQPGDLGTWETGTSSGASTASTGTSGPTPTSSGSSLCLPPQVTCGPNCCPSGSTCTDTSTGLCPCPEGTEQCENACVQSCDGGQSLDLDTCTCPEAACTPENGTCLNHGQCCSGYCGGGTCFVCNGKVCGDFGCIDPNRDSQNCGNCGNVCFAPQVCANGICGCAPNQTPCVFHSECCSKLCFVNTCINCSEVNNGTLTFCGEGQCVDPKNNIDHCGACFNSCPRTSGGVACCGGVCADYNNDSAHCGNCYQACLAGQICHLGTCIAG